MSVVFYLIWHSQETIVLNISEIASSEHDEVSTLQVSSSGKSLKEIELPSYSEITLAPKNTSKYEDRQNVRNILLNKEDDMVVSYDSSATAPEQESVQFENYDPMEVLESDSLSPGFASEKMSLGEGFYIHTEETDDRNGPDKQ